MWWLLAAGAMSALKGASGADAQNAQLATQARADLESMKQLTEQNEAGLTSNLTNMMRTSAKAGLVKIQAGLAARQSAGRRSDLGIEELDAAGQAGAAAAASGTIGASVDAVRADIASKVGRAQLQESEDQEYVQLNFRTQIDDLYNNLDNNLYTPRVGTIREYQKASRTDGMVNGLLSFGSQLGASYAMSSMNLGLGSSGAAAGAGGSSLIDAGIGAAAIA